MSKFYENAIKSIDDINILPTSLGKNNYSIYKLEKEKLINKAKNRIKDMTRAFKLSDFFECKEDIMAGIVITPSQIVIIYGDGEIFHDQIKPIILELINNPTKQNPIIFIRCGIIKGAKVMYPSLIGNSRYVTNEMGQVLEIIIKELRLIGQNDLSKIMEIFRNKWSKGIINKFNRYMAKVGKDKEIVGIELEVFINKAQRENKRNNSKLKCEGR